MVERHLAHLPSRASRSLTARSPALAARRDAPPAQLAPATGSIRGSVPPEVAVVCPVLLAVLLTVVQGFDPFLVVDP